MLCIGRSSKGRCVGGEKESAICDAYVREGERNHSRQSSVRLAETLQAGLDVGRALT